MERDKAAKRVFRREVVLTIEHFYLRVQLARVRRRVSWRTLANTVGISRSRLERIMWGPEELSVEVLERLEWALQVDRAYWQQPLEAKPLPEAERRKRIERAIFGAGKKRRVVQ